MEEYNGSILVQAQASLSSSINSHEEIMNAVAFRRNEIDAYTQGRGGSGTPTSGSSGMVPKDIKKAVESAIPSLIEPFLNNNIVVAKGRDVESDQKAEVVEARLNYVWNYGMKTLPLMELLVRAMMEDGTVFTKTIWNGDRDMPGLEIMNIDAIITDPSAETLDDAAFVIEQKKVSIAEILNNPAWYGEHTLESLSELGAATTEVYDREETGQESYFNFEERLQQLISINIYYGEVVQDIEVVKKVIIWSDDFMINEMDSPYPEDWTHPFNSEVYTRIAGSIYGEGLADLLSVNQKIRTGLNRAILDSLDKGTNGQKGVKKGVLDVANKRKFIQGQDFEYLSQGGLDIWEGQFAETPASVYALLDRVQADSEELSGISRLNGGLDPRALNSGVTATASNIVQSNAERRLLLITRHISALLENVFRDWLDLDVMMLENASVRVGKQIQSISGLDMQGNYDLTLDVATTGQKEQKTQQLTTVIQQLSQNPAIPQSITMRLMSEMVGAMGMYQTEEELMGISKSMAEQEAQPKQPDPAQQAAMQLEMQAKQAATAKDESVAVLNGAKAMETHISNEMLTYGVSNA